jgi:hypothetical protein
VGIYPEKCGFSKRKTSVTGQKLLKRKMVQAMVKKLKAAGKPIDRQAINKEVFDKVRRKR